jgi:hypothetical protein
MRLVIVRQWKVRPCAGGQTSVARGACHRTARTHTLSCSSIAAHGATRSLFSTAEHAQKDDDHLMPAQQGAPIMKGCTHDDSHSVR